MDTEHEGSVSSEDEDPEDPEEKEAERKFQLSRAFSPAAPITRADLFAKRGARMDDVIEVITQPGQHAVVYGERGVGKTSFVAVMGDIYKNVLLTGRTNCSSGDDFTTIWHHVAESISIVLEKPTPGFKRPDSRIVTNAGGVLNQDDLTPNDVRRALSFLAESSSVVVFIDEFDRVTDLKTRRQFADTIKALSDYSVGATILLVGVADSVSELISEHESINRNLVQLHMPRMTPNELTEIIDKGLDVVSMTITSDAKQRIIRLSRGLPHYTHLLALHAARASVEKKRDRITSADVEVAVRRAIEKAQEYISAKYEKAIWSTRESNYEQVLVACALAPVNERGYFAPADVRAPLSEIMGRRYEIPNFINNLNQLATESRGALLQKSGEPRSYRYRFRDPLIQPYVVLRGVDKGLIKYADV